MRSSVKTTTASQHVFLTNAQLALSRLGLNAFERLVTLMSPFGQYGELPLYRISDREIATNTSLFEKMTFNLNGSV